MKTHAGSLGLLGAAPDEATVARAPPKSSSRQPRVIRTGDHSTRKPHPACDTLVQAGYPPGGACSFLGASSHARSPKEKARGYARRAHSHQPGPAWSA
eukprot:364215-Chlamydomonas_euryale.AAC.18